MPFLVITPYLQARDGHREQEGGESKVGVAVHPKSLGSLCCLFLDGTEEGVPKVPFASRRAVRLNIVPEIIVWQFEHAGEKGKQSAVYRLGEVLPRSDVVRRERGKGDVRCRTTRSHP
jgi:hypothetical protein